MKTRKHFKGYANSGVRESNTVLVSDNTKHSAMPQSLTLQQAIDLGVQHHSTGELSKAEQIYQQILKADPEQPVAWHLLGVIAHQTGEHNLAVDRIGKALLCKPNYDEAHNNLGLALQELGKQDEALASFKKAIKFNPEFAAAYNNLGNVLTKRGNLERAVKSYKKALKIKPSFVKAHNNLGSVFRELGRFNEAIISLQKAISLEPDYAEAHSNLGTVYGELSRIDEAFACYEKALILSPGLAEAHYNLGNMLSDTGRLEKAVESYKKALSFNQNYVESYNNLGRALQGLGKCKEAIFFIKKAIDINPDYVVAFNNLGAAYKKLGKLEDAKNSYLAALAIDQNYAEAHSNVGGIYRDLGQFDEAVEHLNQSIRVDPTLIEATKNLLNVIVNLPGLSPKKIFAEHNSIMTSLTQDIVPFSDEWVNDTSPDRTLRVGYLSSDFRNHPVGHNLLPLLCSHNSKRFLVYCYADVQRPDEITEKIRTHVKRWRDITGKTDNQIAAMMREDKLDISVILAGRFDNNRPMVCSHRAAPIQVSYHDVATSGLEEMDYFFTDAFLNPLTTKEMFTEELYRLPVFYQYPEIDEAPPVADVPSKHTEIITFGSFNSPAKLNKEVIELWSKVLKAVPGSQLILKYWNWYDQNSLREKMLERFEDCEIDAKKISFSVKHDTLIEHLDGYKEVDIALDPFPFNGATTTFQALWMGVPVISLVGDTFCSRAAGSILHHTGLDELLADTGEAYVNSASELACDTARLQTLRTTLRERISTSLLCNPSVYAETIEASYREMWQTWCKKTETR